MVVEDRGLGVDRGDLVVAQKETLEVYASGVSQKEPYKLDAALLIPTLFCRIRGYQRIPWDHIYNGILV